MSVPASVTCLARIFSITFLKHESMDIGFMFFATEKSVSLKLGMGVQHAIFHTRANMPRCKRLVKSSGSHVGKVSGSFRIMG